MTTKRPFTEADWHSTPESVREYIESLEDRFTRNSRNSNQPPSSDPPFNKPKKDPKTARKKAKRKRGGQKGHKGHRQELVEPTRVAAVMPDICRCGNTHLPVGGMEPYYTHQVIELPEIRMDVTHFVLHRCACPCCGRLVKARVPHENRFGYGPRLTALIGEMSGVLGMSRENVRHFCRSVFAFYISSGALQRVIYRHQPPCLHFIRRSAVRSGWRHSIMWMRPLFSGKECCNGCGFC